jgi:arabinogalactan endo-1,4-beta-galactosidase
MNKNQGIISLLSFSLLALSSCGTSLPDYSHSYSSTTVGSSTNSEAQNYDSIVVNGPSEALNSEFAYGMDFSEVHQLESLGAHFYNEEGQEEDIFKIMANDGVNYARFRLWVDPWSASGESYGGGGNDTYTDILMAKRAQEAGMKVLIDFHYSDSWADPSKQWKPKSWKNVANADLASTLKSYTADSLNAFKKAGVTVSACQIGNEINNKICGVDSSLKSFTAKLIQAGCEGAKSVFSGIKTIVHLTNIKNTSGVTTYLQNLVDNKVDFDVCGFSYYPYWHGDKTNLLTVLNNAVSLTSKPVMIMETAWGFTDDSNENCINQFTTSSFGLAGGYETSPQGQATEIADIVSVLSQVPNQNGQGLFYWGGDWIPVANDNWVSKAGAYYNDFGQDGSGTYSDSYIKPSWCNQALFSYSGKALPSASTYKHIKNLDKTATEVVSSLLTNELTATINLADSDSTMPTSAQGVTNTGAYRDLTITWDATEVKNMYSKGDGTYTIHGTTSQGNIAVTCIVTAESNYVQDYSFEKQADGKEVAVSSPWTVTSSPNTSASGASGEAKSTAHIEAKSEGNRTGTKYFHWYDTAAMSWSLSQKVTGVRKGIYSLKTYIMAEFKTSATTNAMNLWASVNGGTKITKDGTSSVQGWFSDLKTGMKEIAITGITISSDNATVDIGLDCVATAESWGHNDDWSLVKTADLS